MPFRPQSQQYRTETRPLTLTNLTDRDIAGLTTSIGGVPSNRLGGSVPKTDLALINLTDYAPLVQPHDISVALRRLDGALPHDLLKIAQVRTLAQ